MRQCPGLACWPIMAGRLGDRVRLGFVSQSVPGRRPRAGFSRALRALAEQPGVGSRDRYGSCGLTPGWADTGGAGGGGEHVPAVGQ
jgi:hypothetical protein